MASFFMRNIVYVYFLYGLAFFAIGLVVLLESGRASEFRFARALRPLGLFGFVHAGHEWFEMFQIFAAHEAGYQAGVPEEVIRVATLVASFLLLLGFGTRLLPDAERHPRAWWWQVALLGLAWLAGVAYLAWRFKPAFGDLLIAADVLARYSLGIPGALLASWALLRERRDFHARGMSAYGQDLLWAGLAFFVYGAIGQFFGRPSLVYPSQTINTAFFLRTFGIPVQLLRSFAGAAVAITLGRALRAFEQESRLRLARANKARIEAQAAALAAQERRADEVEALNVRLRTTAGELSAMVELSQILSSTMELDLLLRYALYQIVHSFDNACCGAVYLDRGRGDLELAGEYCRLEGRGHLAPPARVAAPTPQGLSAAAKRAVESGQATAVGPDELVYLLERNDPGGEGPDAISANGMHAKAYRALCVPLSVKQQLIGGLAIASQSEGTPFDGGELGLLTAFAQQVANSVENAKLYGVVQEREAQLEQLLHQLVTAQEGERQRIARELHDETGQKLTALAMGLAAVESHLALTGDQSVARKGAVEGSVLSDAKGEEPPGNAAISGPGPATTAGSLRHAVGQVAGLRQVADQAIVELRNIMANLRPSQLDDLGLGPALRWYVQQYSARHLELQVNLMADRLVQRLPPQHEIILFRAAQEALTNVVRHAHASQVTVSLVRGPDVVRLEVSDDGVGFDASAPVRQEDGGGWGLLGMRERVALVGGLCDVRSRPGEGTRVVVELPLNGIRNA